MGTLFTIDLYAVDEDAADHAMSVAFDEVDRLDALLSNYRPSSELSRISREAGRGAVTTDPETFRFLERSLYWSQQSEGAFDIKVLCCGRGDSFSMVGEYRPTRSLRRCARRRGGRRCGSMRRCVR
jgi:thiamine biosynthesis lipoprotein